ncbi:Ku protein [Streptomyces sp. 900105755]
MVSATEDHSLRVHQYHVEDMARVRVRKFCEIEDREVRSDEIGKGFGLTKTRVIPISDQELRNLPLPAAKGLEIHGFVPWESIDALRIGEGYHPQPDGPVAANAVRAAASGTSAVLAGRGDEVCVERPGAAGAATGPG